MDAFAWTVIGSVAAVAGVVAAIVFGMVPVLAGWWRRREAAAEEEGRAELAAARRLGRLLPAPVLGVQVRGRDELVGVRCWRGWR